MGRHQDFVSAVQERVMFSLQSESIPQFQQETGSTSDVEDQGAACLEG
jgi:hypothetical protein